MAETRDPIGVVLAGGAGRRIGGTKAIVRLRDRPLVLYPLCALQAVLAEVVVVVKPDTELPPLPGVPVWTEPAEPRHPLAGIVHALERTGPPAGIPGKGRAIVVCAGDLPFACPELVERLVHVDVDAGGARAVVPRVDGRLQPLFARYEPAALAPLAAVLGRRPLPRLTDAISALDPQVLELDDERPFFNVNVPEDLLTAAGLLDRRDPRNAD